jgi:predicted peptidase
MSEGSYSVEKGGPLPYLLAVPAGRDAAHPVLCFLHGHDEGPPTPIEEALTRHGPFRPGNPTSSLGLFIIVAPQMPVRGDLWRGYAEDVHRIVLHVQKQYGGDPQRTYLTGFSFGGNGVFDLALDQPGRWTALWAVDPTRIPERDPGCPVWLSVGILARARKKSFTRALDLQGLQENKDLDRIILDEGADHVGSATSAYRDERVYAWLLSKRKR